MFIAGHLRLPLVKSRDTHYLLTSTQLRRAISRLLTSIELSLVLQTPFELFVSVNNSRLSRQLSLFDLPTLLMHLIFNLDLNNYLLVDNQSSGWYVNPSDFVRQNITLLCVIPLSPLFETTQQLTLVS